MRTLNQCKKKCNEVSVNIVNISIICTDQVIIGNDNDNLEYTNNYLFIEVKICNMQLINDKIISFYL